MNAWITRNRRLLLLLGLAAVLYFAWGELTRTRGAQTVNFVQAEVECGTLGNLRYCVNSAVGGTNGDVVYHLHGRNLDETIWNDETYYTALIQAEWQRTRTRPPKVVTISYGETWLLIPKGQEEASGLLEDFMARLPELEEQIGTPRRRILLGESMGGLNVLVAGFSQADRFAKIAALCPGVYIDSPFAPLSDQLAGLERTGADPMTAFGVAMMARRHLANEDEWSRVSPLALIERVEPRTVELYLSNGLYDKFGNFEGTQRLAQVATRRGITTSWHPLYGGHCAIDAPSLASFLVS
ncbi:MAG: esterase family protein [Sphingomonadales bacterium]|nr:esterase family protein [Sphingomonadales bacterium]